MQAPLYFANTRGRSAGCQQQRRLSSRSLCDSRPSGRKYVSACAVSSTRSSWVLHLPTACGLHCPFAAAVVTKSRSNLVPSPSSLPHVSKTSDRTATPYRFVFSTSPAIAAIPGFDALKEKRSAYGDHTLTSIQSCCRTPGNQETTSKMAHRTSGAASLLFFTQPQSSGTWRSMSAKPAACWIMQRAQDWPWLLRTSSKKG